MTLYSAVKPGVDVEDLRFRMVEYVDKIVWMCFLGMGYASVITSALDGKHSTNSLHYTGFALDYRTRHLLDGVPRVLQRRISDCLGSEFDVVLESDHIHIEYDPK